jgi:ergothioneine biosynthesis protein EgtB
MLDRQAAVAWYQRNRARSRQLFDMVAPGGDRAYYTRPISQRHPLVFYEGHLPAFSFNTLVKRALGGPSIDERLELLFARGIDPHELAAGPAEAGPHVAGPRMGWPSREDVRAFVAEADRRVLDALCRGDLDRPGHPLLDKAEAVFTILEHEAMHHETLLYMWHRLPLEDKQPPPGYGPRVGGASPPQEWMSVSGGRVTLGANRQDLVFGWDNEFPFCTAEVKSFEIERYDVTNAQFLEFVDAGGYAEPRWWRTEDWNWIQREAVSHPLFWERGEGRRGGNGGRGGKDGNGGNETDWYWHGMFDLIPLPLAWPVYVSQAEASAYARWKGARLPTEAEYHRAAFGSPDASSGDGRRYPWGDEPPSAAHGVFDYLSWDPGPVGSHPAGRSAWGIDDLVGNGWEWTSTPFAPFPGFRAMASYPEYSADFFDGEHSVMKGASPVTAVELLRPTFRNWFRQRYPYIYATFRCVRC